MMNIFFSWLKRKYNQEIDATGLAFFRMFFALVLFCEIKHIAEFAHLIYDSVPYLHISDINLDVAFAIWLTSIFFIFLGLLTRLASIVNYILSLIFIGFIGDFEYHVFYAYMGINFLIMFMPVSRVWSLDRLIEKLKYSNAKFHYNPSKTTSVFSYWIPLFVGVGLVYFDSTFFKITDDIWMSGMGLWWPASHVCATYIAMPELLNQKWLMLFLGYLTVLFEMIFLFLFYFKRVRWVFWFIGMGLHMGILIFFPIPFFALTVVAIYILLIPVSFYKKFERFRYTERVTFYYDGECPLCARTKIVLDHFDLFHLIQFKTVQSSHSSDEIISKIPMEELLDDIHAVDRHGNVYKGFETYKAVFKANFLFWPLYLVMLIPGVSFLGNKIYFLISRNRITERCTDESCGITFIQLPKKDEEVKLFKNLSLNDVKFSFVLIFVSFCILSQSLFIYSAHPMQGFLPYSYEQSDLNESIKNVSQDLHPYCKSFFGITHHPVFGRYHFAERDDLIKVEFVGEQGQKQLLPITKEDGRPGEYVTGCSWVHWNFRVLSSEVDSAKFVRGIERYTAFWLKQNVSGNLNGHFVLYRKSMTVPDHWENDALRRDLENNQWEMIGVADWRDNTFYCDFQKFD
jgi:predicted DCC family thiol-disulfide oxidoreductase YuxK